MHDLYSFAVDYMFIWDYLNPFLTELVWIKINTRLCFNSIPDIEMVHTGSWYSWKENNHLYWILPYSIRWFGWWWDGDTGSHDLAGLIRIPHVKG